MFKTRVSHTQLSLLHFFNFVKIAQFIILSLITLTLWGKGGRIVEMDVHVKISLAVERKNDQKRINDDHRLSC